MNSLSGAPPPPEPVRVVILGDSVITDHLRDRFSDCPGAHLISGGRAGTIVSEISPPLRRRTDERFLAAFCEYLPADCIIRNVGTNDLELVLFLKDGVQ
ncbi:MAG: hypothetical protein HY343_13050, partial [Lentisphaerae bacterium]|nr:hypothetical protein [Lentisphaerota bacterium]